MKIKCEYCDNYMDDSEEKCPSCGAKIKEASNATCDYCNAVIVNSSSNWVLISKEKI